MQREFISSLQTSNNLTIIIAPNRPAGLKIEANEQEGTTFLQFSHHSCSKSVDLASILTHWGTVTQICVICVINVKDG
jgi:hypothetical protein